MTGCANPREGDGLAHGPHCKHDGVLSGNLQSNTGETLRIAAVRGQGLIHAPTFMVADELKSGRLRRTFTSRE
jgi:DNA-binding transcriptional LysR family regulator